MKNMKKLLVASTVAAITSLTIISSAFAAVDFTDTDISGTYDKDLGTVSIAESVLEGLSGQTTIIIYENTADDTALTADDILYINQDDADTVKTFTGMGMKNGIEDGKTYVIKMGGGNIEAGILSTEFEVKGEEIKYLIGDVNNDTSADPADALLIIRADLALDAALEGAALTAGDVNNDASADPADALLIIRADLGLDAPLNPVE